MAKVNSNHPKAMGSCEHVHRTFVETETEEGCLHVVGYNHCLLSSIFTFLSQLAICIFDLATTLHILRVSYYNFIHQLS